MHQRLVAACSEGVGAPEFARMLQSGLADAEFLDRIQGAHVTVDQWQLEKLAMVTTRQHLHWFVPGLAAEYQAALWGQSHATVQSAIADLVATLSPRATIAVIPEGPYVLAKARTGEMATR